MSRSALGRVTSILGPSNLGPLKPNDGILILGILNPPSGPSMSTSGPAMFTLGAFMSPSSFGPFRLKSISGIETFGPDKDGILNLGPLILPSGPSTSNSGPLMSTLGALMSMSALGRLRSTSGPSSFGPLKPKDGIFILG